MTKTREPLAPRPPRRLPRALTPFRTPAYRRLAVALVLTMFTWGTWIVALVWEVIRQGGGPGQLSLVTGANAAGMLAPCLFAGVVADRIPQKLILIVVAAVQFTSVCTIAVLSLTDLAQLWHLVVASLCFGLATSFYYPAYSAWLPSLVPQEDLLAVNGFEGMVRPAFGQAVGPAVAGFVVGAAAPGWAILVAAAAGALGLLSLLPVPLTPVRREGAPERETQHPIRTTLQDIGEGFGYMWRTPWLLATLIYAAVMTLMVMGPFEVLVPFLVKDHLDGGANHHAWILAAFGVGGAAGSFVVASLPMARRYLTVMTLTWGAACLPLALFGVVSHVWMLVALGFLLGAMLSGPMVIWGTLLQRRVPPHMLGRISSLDFFISISLMPVSMAAAGPVAELIGLRETFFIAGAVPLVVAVIAVVWARLPQDELANPLD